MCFAVVLYVLTRTNLLYLTNVPCGELPRKSMFIDIIDPLNILQEDG